MRQRVNLADLIQRIREGDPEAVALDWEAVCPECKNTIEDLLPFLHLLGTDCPDCECEMVAEIIDEEEP